MPTGEKLVLLACQIDIPAITTAVERDAHLERSAQSVREQLRQRAADIVVLPELSSIDYSRAAFDRLSEIAETLDGASFQCWSALAKEFGVYVSYSFARQAEQGVHIAVAVAGRDGRLIGFYDKLHLAHYGASMEKDYFIRGDHMLTFKVKGFTLAPIICYDIRIPELSRALVVDHGVDVILHCGAYYRDASYHTWHAFATARALENQVFFLSLNRAGENYGNSLFCAPWLDDKVRPIYFQENREEFKFIEISRDVLEVAREEYSFLKDRLSSYKIPVQSAL